MNAPYGRCPDDEVLKELAAGLSSPELAERTLQHVSRCSVCGPALKRYIREFSDQETPETSRLLAQLESSKPEWQRKLVRKAVPGKRSRWPRLIPVFAGLAAVLLALIEGPYLLAVFQIHKGRKDVAAAFAERRTTEMRLPSTDYAAFRPFPHELGGESGRSVDDLPPSLHNALSAAIENLKKPNADPHWLQIQGRAFLWENTPSSLEKAEKNFEKARAGGLNTPDLEIDLATAYYERDNQSDQPNLQRTLDLLNKVLSEPRLTGQQRASALFNLAIAYERTQAWDLAVSTWEKYLQVDSSSPWAEEARRHLKEGKEKIEKPAASSSLDSGSFLKDAGEATVNDHVEEYLDVVVTSWLPDGLENRESPSWTAAQKLAGVLTTQHQDLWLKDLLSSLSGKDGPGIRALALAVQENGRGEHARAMDQAREAARLFAQSRSPAGEFRAQLEEVNALRRTLNGPACLARADPLLRKLATTKYYWLQARVAVEKAECGNLVGAFAESDSSLTLSRRIATDHDFPFLALRDIGIAAGNQRLRGDCGEGWQQNVAGLHIYWQRAFARDRLYQFYSVMYQCGLQDGALYSGEAFLRHAIAMRETGSEIKKNLNIEGVLHLQLAHILEVRGVTQEAQQEYQRSSALLPPQGLPKKFKLILDLEPAEFQLHQGKAREALATLEPLRKLLAENPDGFFSLRFYEIQAAAQFQLQHLDEAAVSYHNAINIADSALDKIDDWRERLQWLRATDESYRGLVRVLLEQKKTLEALQGWELYRSKPLLNAKLAGDRTRDAAQKGVSAQTGGLQVIAGEKLPRIVYAEFADGVQIWVSWHGQIRGSWVKIDRQDLDSANRQFMEWCATDSSKLSDIQELGTRLFAILLQPVASALPPFGDLVIELDPSAYDLPMEALRTPEGKYFGENYSIVYSPGIWMENELRSPGPITGRESLTLVDASHGYLPGFATQRETIARLFPKTQIVDSFTTDWSITRARLGSTQLFHYMGHGRPDGSGTSLDYDAQRSLHAYDFAPGMLSRTELVVLAACSGAAGREYGIADTSNLVHVFFAAGVPSVVASHWNVDARASSQLMSTFYQHLRNKESVARAMYNARVELLLANPHPYFWAGFGLSGRAG